MPKVWRRGLRSGRNLRIDHCVTETVSGTVAAAERELGKLVPKLRQVTRC